MHKKKWFIQPVFFYLAISGLLLTAFTLFNQPLKPCLYIIGDSTVKNGSGKGDNNLWGWGDFIAEKLDTNLIEIFNCALGGTSSRTFITRGLWEDRVLKQLKPGDFVIVQFGHNDAGPLDDTARARGTIRGIGDEYKEIDNPIMKKQETVYTYGHYLRQFVNDAKAKGATCILCSPVPRCRFKDGKTERSDTDYGAWAAAVADEMHVGFIPLNQFIAEKYDAMGPEITKLFFPSDNTHTNEIGARINALCVKQGIMSLPECKLKEYVKQ
jgi:lysophospholipase L1-like esterase